MQSAPDRPIVCYVTDGRDFPADDRKRLLLTHVRMALEAGTDWVQIREKDISARHLLTQTRDVVRLADGIAPAAQILVNDRLDVAIAAKASGAHLGGESISPDAAVRWCRGNAVASFRIGVSCHSIEDVQRAESVGADYLFFGPIFDTPSKRNFGTPQGLARLMEVCCAVRIPVIAIGGITAASAADCIRSGAKGIAAIRLFQEARDACAVRDFVSQVHGLRI